MVQINETALVISDNRVKLAPFESAYSRAGRVTLEYLNITSARSLKLDDYVEVRRAIEGLVK